MKKLEKKPTKQETHHSPFVGLGFILDIEINFAICFSFLFFRNSVVVDETDFDFVFCTIYI